MLTIVHESVNFKEIGHDKMRNHYMRQYSSDFPLNVSFLCYAFIMSSEEGLDGRDGLLPLGYFV